MPPDPRPSRWGLAGCCQLDPSHPTLVNCAVGREGRHAPRPNDVGGQPRFPGAKNGGDPAASGDLRLGHRAPGRGGRRASIPLHALTTLRSAPGAFGLWEFRVSQQISTFYGPSVQTMETRLGARQRRRPPTVHRLWEFRVSQQISTFYGPSVQTMETRLGARQRRRPPTVHRGRTHAPRLQRPVAREDEASACSELRLGYHPETPAIEPCPIYRKLGMVQERPFSGNTWDLTRTLIGPAR